MITVTKTVNSCVYNRTVPCIYLWSHVPLPAESDLNRQLKTYISQYNQHKHYSLWTHWINGGSIHSNLATFAEDLLLAPAFQAGLRGKNIPSVGCWHGGGSHDHMNTSPEMRMCQKLNSKMRRDSGFVFWVLSSLTTQTVLCCDKSVALFVSLADNHIKDNQMIFDSMFIA